MMEAVILAGGFGTRLRSAVPDLPKVMAPIAGRPFLEVLLNSLSRKGIARAVLSLGYMADTIQTHFGHGFAGIELAYEVETTPLGTGGAARLALTACKADHAIILNGDTYLDLELDAIERQWRENGHPVIIGREVADTARYGRLNHNGGRVTGFTEKGVAGAGVINGGSYVLRKNQLDAFAMHQPFSIETDYLALEVAKSRFDLFISKGHFIDIGIPDDYARAQLELADL